MSSPTSIRDPNLTTRHRTYPHPLEEDGFISALNSSQTAVTSTPVVSPGTASEKRGRLQGISQHLNLQENKEELVRYWDRFIRKGKKKVGVIASLRTLALSSCAIHSLLLILAYWHHLLRAEYPTIINTTGLGVSLSRMVTYKHLYS
jgi:hypothetical protein